jgi:AraC-like DNA-binding protein
MIGGPGVDIFDDRNPVRVAFHFKESFVAEYNVTLAVLHFREETEGRLKVRYASFPHHPDDLDYIERLFACPVRVGAPWAGITLDREAWELPLRRRDSILRGVLERQAEDAIAKEPALDAAILDVRRVLASRLARGDTQIQSVARALSMAARSLQRRLAAAGVSFNQLLDRVRKEAAERSLSDSPLSITEIAYALGYSEPAAFTRAFKRWYDDSPQSFRQRQRRRVSVS